MIYNDICRYLQSRMIETKEDDINIATDYYNKITSMPEDKVNRNLRYRLEDVLIDSKVF